MRDLSHLGPLQCGGEPQHTARVRMRKLLRSSSTKAFLTKGGTWTHDLTQAAEVTGFSGPRAATRNPSASGFEIYYSFHPNGPSQWDFALPLD